MFNWSSVYLRSVKFFHASALVSMTPLLALEESAEPVDLFQPVTEVAMTVFEDSVVYLKFAFLIRPSSVRVSSSFSVEEEEEDVEEESSPPAQDANNAPAEDSIITDKRNARNLLLRVLFVVFI